MQTCPSPMSFLRGCNSSSAEGEVAHRLDIQVNPWGAWKTREDGAPSLATGAAPQEASVH